MTAELHLGDARKLVLDVEGPVHCIVTDPPYGVDHRSKFAQTPKGRRYTRKLAGDKTLDQALDLFTEVMIPLADKLPEQGEVYVFTSWKVLPAWWEAVDALHDDLRVVNVLIWEKGWPGLGDLDCNWPFSYEMILYAKKGRRQVKSRRSSVLAIDRMNPRKHIHPSEKPVELIQELLAQSTSSGDLVVDPFAGSASTLLAAQRMGRRAIGFEVDPDYYRDAKARLSQGSLF